MSQFKPILWVFVCALTTLFLYQNCSQPMELSQSSGAGDFAFDAKIDTFSYMSCVDVEDNIDTQTFFTFRMGAYESGGLKLTEDFQRATTNLTDNRKIDMLVNSEKNADIQLQMAMRSQDLGIYYGKSEKGRGFDLMLPPVNNSDLLNALVDLNSNERLFFLPNSGNEGRFEGSLVFRDTDEGSFITAADNGYVTLNYHHIKAEDNFAALSPSDFASDENATLDFSRAFGTGFDLAFQLGSSNSSQRRVLSSIKEVDLETKQNVGSNWSCPQSMRFMIVRPEDVGVSGSNGLIVDCKNLNQLFDPAVLPPDLAQVRRVLPVDDWYIDMENRCAIPKRAGVGSCYAPGQVAYKGGACTDDQSGTFKCPRFVSICVNQ